MSTETSTSTETAASAETTETVTTHTVVGFYAHAEPEDDHSTGIQPPTTTPNPRRSPHESPEHDAPPTRISVPLQRPRAPSQPTAGPSRRTRSRAGARSANPQEPETMDNSRAIRRRALEQAAVAERLWEQELAAARERLQRSKGKDRETSDNPSGPYNAGNPHPGDTELHAPIPGVPEDFDPHYWDDPLAHPERHLTRSEQWEIERAREDEETERYEEMSRSNAQLAEQHRQMLAEDQRRRVRTTYERDSTLKPGARPSPRPVGLQFPRRAGGQPHRFQRGRTPRNPFGHRARAYTIRSTCTARHYLYARTSGDCDQPQRPTSRGRDGIYEPRRIQLLLPRS